MAELDKIVLNGVEYEIAGSGGTGTGLTEDIKVALLDCFANVAWVSSDGQQYYDALENTLYPPANLVRISVTYNQSGVVYDTASLDDLKTDLVVLAHFDDGTSQAVSDYVLSGTLSKGTRTITVTYGGKTATFTVVVTHLDTSIYNWDFTQSIIDSKQGASAVLGANVTQSGSGLTFTNGDGAYVYLADMSAYASGQLTIEADVSSIVLDGNYNNRFLNLGNSGTSAAIGYGFAYRDGSWKWYTASGGAQEGDNPITNMNAFNNKTVKMQIDYPNKIRRVFVDDVLLSTYTMGYAGSNGRNYIWLGANNASGALRTGTVIKAVRIYGGLV